MKTLAFASRHAGYVARMMPCRMLVSCMLVCMGLALPRTGEAQPVVAQWTLQPADAQPDMQFGRSVAVAGDLVVVGAPGDSTNGAKAGAVYVFERIGTQWAQTKLVPPDGETNARFGWKVGVAGGRIVVAAPWASNPVANRSGTIYLYEKDADTWRYDELRVDDSAVEGQIGRGLAMVPGRIVAGAPYDSTRHGPAAGSLVVFEETPEGWTSQTLVPEDGAPNAWFGLTVAARANRVAAGAYHMTQPSGPEAGAASVFERTPRGWREHPLAPRGTPARQDHFGRAVALHENRVFVGAEEDDNANGTNAGGVLALRLDRSDIAPALLIPSDGAPRSYLGFALATTDEYLAASEDAEVRLFPLHGTAGATGQRLSTLLGASLPSGVLALAGSAQRLVVAMPFADAGAAASGTVIVVDLAP